MRLADFRAVLPAGDFWVFGYGSLMWSPCFAYRDRRLARVHGYHRALCILSTRYRGTHRKPGLVMGLCRGGSCWGMAYRIPRNEVGRSLARLWSREMPRRVYEPRVVPAMLPDGSAGTDGIRLPRRRQQRRNSERSPVWAKARDKPGGNKFPWRARP